MMPSMMPCIGPRKPGVFYNTGHGHLGWTLSCISAQMVGDMIHTQHNQINEKATERKTPSTGRHKHSNTGQ